MDLTRIESTNTKIPAKVISQEDRQKIVADYRASEKRLIFLDYDGTLCNLPPVPEQAVTSDKLLTLIKEMSEVDGNHIVIISGRKASDLEKWFGPYKVTLVAEHGCLYRLPLTSEWLQMANVDVSWKEKVKEILSRQALLYPGSYIEEKIYSVAWHYRKIHDEVDEKTLIELNKKLSAVNPNNSFKVLQGNQVLETKCVSINKGLAAQKLLASGNFDFVMAIGDDRTDEDMFGMLNKDSHVTIKVGLDKTKAKYNLIGLHHVLSFLDQMRYLN